MLNFVNYVKKRSYIFFFFNFFFTSFYGKISNFELKIFFLMVKCILQLEFSIAIKKINIKYLLNSKILNYLQYGGFLLNSKNKRNFLNYIQLIYLNKIQSILTNFDSHS